MQTRRALLFCSAILLLLASAHAATLWEVISSDPQLTKLTYAIQASNLVDILNGTTMRTMIAPTDDAWSKFGLWGGDEIWRRLISGQTDSLAYITAYHILSDALPSRELRDHISLPTFLSSANEPNTVQAFVNDKLYKSPQIYFENARVIAADIQADNGVMHKVAAVMHPTNLGTPPWTIMEQLRSVPANSVLVSLLDLTGLSAALDNQTYFWTVVAPTNDAFARFPQSVLTALTQPANRALLTSILKYHVVTEFVDFDAGIVGYRDEFQTAQGAKLIAYQDPGFLFWVNYAAPPYDNLWNLAAFSNVAWDCINGAFYPIDNVLLPPGLAAQLQLLVEDAVVEDAVESMLEVSAPPMTVYEVLQSNPSFSLFTQYLTQTGLYTTLTNKKSSFTVFAPTNDAFKRLPANLLRDLTCPELWCRADLNATLNFHIQEGNAWMSTDLKDRMDISTKEPRSFSPYPNRTVFVQYGTNAIYIDYAQVVIPNVAASNGVIHGVDYVVYNDGVFNGEAQSVAAASSSNIKTSSRRRSMPVKTALSRRIRTGRSAANRRVNTLSKASLQMRTQIQQAHRVGLSASSQAMLGTPLQNMTIMQYLQSKPQYSSFVSAVMAAKVDGDLNRLSGTFTVMVPNNDAFAMLDSTQVQGLSSNDVHNLVTYHISPVQINTNTLLNGNSIRTDAAASISVYSGIAGHFHFDFANLTETRDILCLNGYVNEIDRVLQPPKSPSLLEYILSEPELSEFAQMYVATGLRTAVNLEGFMTSFTAFLPTNAAIAKLPAELVNRMKDATLQPNQFAVSDLMFILASHFIESDVAFASKSLMDSQLVINDAFRTYQIFVPPGLSTTPVFINYAQITKFDIPVANGIVHKIDTMLIPRDYHLSFTPYEQLKLSPRHSTFVQLLESTNLAAVLANASMPSDFTSPFLVFAPTNDAFASLPQNIQQALRDPAQKALVYNILSNHIAVHLDFFSIDDRQSFNTSNGDSVKLYTDVSPDARQCYINYATMENGCEGLCTDYGCVYVMDSVLFPKSAAAELAALSSSSNADMTSASVEIASQAPPSLTIADLIDSTSSLKVLSSLIKAANLTSALSASGAFTVIAPSDDAFTRYQATFGNLADFANDVTKLRKLLLYHVFPVAATSSQLQDRAQAQTLLGEPVDVYVNANRQNVYFNYGQVLLADRLATNGVVHVIDHLLLPNQNLMEPAVKKSANPFASMSKRSSARAAKISQPERELKSASEADDVVLMSGNFFPGSIAQYLTANPIFSSLVAALTKADLMTVLNLPNNLTKTGDYTLFAPNNDAFTKLAPGALDGLSKRALQNVLLYHVLPAPFTSLELPHASVSDLQTLYGYNLRVQVLSMGEVYADYAQLSTVRNVVCTNGIVHGISTPLLSVNTVNPPTEAPTAAPTGAPTSNPSSTPTVAPSDAPAASSTSPVLLYVLPAVGGVIAIAAAFFVWTRCVKKQQSDDRGERLLDSASVQS